MRLTDAHVDKVLGLIEDASAVLKETRERGYPYGEWERRRSKVRDRLRLLPNLIQEACECIRVPRSAGRPRKGTLAQRLTLFLFSRMFDRSNRDTRDLLGFFSPIFSIEVSEKTIERLYSEPEIKLALHNLFILLVGTEPISGEFSGDGTGYSLTVTRLYSASVLKEGRDYIYAFRLIDLQTGLYVGYGYSRRSEKEAFDKAIVMIKKMGVEIDSIALDRYYSTQNVATLFGKRTLLFLIPKKNLRTISIEWTRILRRFLQDPIGYLSSYHRRSLSEAAFSADKNRLGRKIRQKLDDRRETATTSIAVLHNVFSIRVALT